jgi:tetratricopeptide (TPR) repeat protein
MRRTSSILFVLLFVPGPGASAQDSRASLRAELRDLWIEQRHEELLKRVQPELAERADAADLWMMAAEAALKTEDAARAIACFEKSVTLAPALKAHAINLGFAYLKADRHADAKKVFDPFLQDADKPRAAKAQYGLGLVLTAQGDAAGAKKAFESSASLNPSDGRALYRLAQISLQGGDWRQAVGMFAAVLDKDDLQHGAAYGLARAYAAGGLDERAAQAAARHQAILAVSDALPGMIRKLGAARDPVAARLAIADALAAAEATRSADVWVQRARAIDPKHPALALRQGGALPPESRR